MSDVALVTPLRDGMNLVAKEFIAARTDKTGVLILSEMAGAADELAESIIVNPNNMEEIATALDDALHMPVQEQSRRLDIMQKRISRYDVFKWADDFLLSLNSIKEKQKRLSAHTLSVTDRKKLMSQFARANRRILFLDYDGTLTPFADHYKNALPGKELIKTLEQLSMIQGVEIIIISGRDRHTLEEWFGTMPVHLVAEHGLFIRKLYSDWRLLKPIRGRWKKKILPILKLYADKLPGALIEEKEYSLVFHYRRSEPAFASIRVKELTEYLVNYTSNMDIQIMNGNKVLEVRNAGIDKGVAAMYWLPERKKSTDFIMAIGDDRTDEDVFRVMPKDAFTIKVGIKPSYAKYNLFSSDEVLRLLNDFSHARAPSPKKVHDAIMHF
jgi:trehalose 6-phosphate synthase/phosphatase